MKKRIRKITALLMLIIIILLFLSTLPGLSFLLDMALTLFIPFAAFSGKDTKNRSVSYSYMSLALITALFLLFKNALS